MRRPGRGGPRTAFGTERDAERVGCCRVELTRALLLRDRVADCGDTVVHREDEDPIVVALERLTRAHLFELDGIAELADDPADALIEIAQARRPVDRQW